MLYVNICDCVKHVTVTARQDTQSLTRTGH